MPYRKKSYGGKKKRYYKRPGRYAIYKSAGSQLWKDVMWLKSVVNVEKKYNDVALTGQTVGTAATLNILNGIATGTSATTRNGQSIKCVSNYCDGFVKINASATESIVRFMIVVDKQPNGAVFLSSDLLSAVDTVGALNIGNSHRFKVLMDKRFTLSINGNEIKYFKYYLRPKFHTEYNTGSAGTIADIQTNSLYMLYISNEGTNTPFITFYNRFRWIDN